MMPPQTIQPYLSFNGRAEEAIDFYRRALGAEVEMMMRFKDSPEPCPEGMVPPGSEGKIMHACIKIGGASVMASDGDCKSKPSFQGFSLSYTASDEKTADHVFAALADGGQVPLTFADDRTSAKKWSELGIDAQSFSGISVDQFEVVELGNEVNLTYECVRNK